MRETLTAVKNGSDYIEGSPTLFQWFTCREKNQGKMKKKNDRIRPEIEKNKKNKGNIFSLNFFRRGKDNFSIFSFFPEVHLTIKSGQQGLLPISSMIAFY
jgi:hypothetical protein